jgi:copper chaperone CopZ
MRTAPAVALFTVLLPAASLAELRTVEIRVSGLDCASCAESVDRRLGRIRGVDSAKFDPSKSTASLKLKPENTVTLDAIRDALKSMGYTPEEASIVVNGEVSGGILSMKHQKNAFQVEGASDSGSLTIEGSVASGTNRLQARSVRAE